MNKLEAELAERMQRRYARMVGRGTTALFVALRALALDSDSGPGEVILPDVICSAVLDGVLLAGFVPIFAAVSAPRFGLDADDVRRKRGPATCAVIIPHLFGYVMNMPDFGVPIIEDAVQGLGGTSSAGPVGTLGKVSFTSFHETKMIGGRGGVVATDEAALWEAIRSVKLDAFPAPPDHLGVRYRQYRHQLEARQTALICEFDPRDANVEAIRRDWKTLASRVAIRNQKACYLRNGLSALGLLHLPEVASGDAIWRYTFAAKNRATTHWILRHLQSAGLSGSHLYPSLSDMFEPASLAQPDQIAPLLINLWVDEATTTAQLDKAIDVIAAAPN